MNGVLVEGLRDVGMVALVILVALLMLSQAGGKRASDRMATVFVVSVAVVFVLSLAAAAVRLIIAQ